MHVLDQGSLSVLAVGLLSSLVLLAASSQPPSLTVSQLQGLDGGSEVTVSGLVVSVRSFDGGTEVLVLADEHVPATARVVCTAGPGPPPSEVLSIGDLARVSGECVLEEGVPTVFCTYGHAWLLQPSEEVLTVDTLCESWRLFEGDRVRLTGVSILDETGTLRLFGEDGGRSIAMVLGAGVGPIEGEVSVDCVLEVDQSTMVLVLKVSALAAS